MSLFSFRKKKKDGGEEKPVVPPAGIKRDKKEVGASEGMNKSETPKVKAVKKSLKKAKETRRRALLGRQVLENVLVRPRITEKATFATEQGVYVFEVASSANKYQIAEAIEHFYKVSPRKINIVRIPAKRIRSRLRGRFGVVSPGKKAYVYLKEGDTIEVM